MQKPMPNAARSRGFRRLRDRTVDEHRAGEVHSGKEIEIPCQAEVVGDRCREQAADEVAGDVASDVGGERAAGIGVAALFPEIRQGQRECRGHAEALADAQQHEHRQVRRDREQCRRDRERDQAQQNAHATVDSYANQRYHQSGDGHPDCARVDRKTHCGRRHPVGARERWKNGLGREQVDHGEKRREADDDGSQQTPRRMSVHLHGAASIVVADGLMVDHPSCRAH
jgi:hypothetical protein